MSGVDSPPDRVQSEVITTTEKSHITTNFVQEATSSVNYMINPVRPSIKTSSRYSEPTSLEQIYICVVEVPTHKRGFT